MIEVRDLSVSLGDFILNNVSFTARDGEYFIILGPSGAGKTVILEAIAGVHRPLNGRILLNGQDITFLEPEKRRIGMVYQDYALFPHLSVKENLVFSLHMQKVSRLKRAEQLNWVAELLGISHLLNRRPDTLSGGERQKVALGRALVSRPQLLLLDEPLSALDPEGRENIQHELRRLHGLLGITTLHVTHDFEEAVALGERIAIIGGGSLVQVGTPEDIFRHPKSEFVARFALTRNIFRGMAEKRDTGDTVFRVDGTEFVIASDKQGSYYASIRPEDVLVSAEPVRSSARNCLPGTVVQVVDRGSTLYIMVDIPPVIYCLVTRHSYEEMGLVPGKKVYVTFKASAVHLFE